ncbi:MAG: TerD family protein [Defluviitaleaceae bacterium]|nr:TerD family protein [Defluviitaleaceae bacterium]
MGVNLQKGQKVDLTKGNAKLSTLMVGLGWDEAEGPAGKGLFGKIFKWNIDCDASVLVLTDGKLESDSDLVYFANKKHKSGAIVHQGDNLTGGSDGDDEQIKVDLDKLPANCDKLVFVVNIFMAKTKKQHFGMVNNAFIRIVNDQTGEELCKYNLSENYDNMTAMIFGEVYRHENEWKFSAIGEATKDPGLRELAAGYS